MTLETVVLSLLGGLIGAVIGALVGFFGALELQRRTDVARRASACRAVFLEVTRDATAISRGNPGLLSTAAWDSQWVAVTESLTLDEAITVQSAYIGVAQHLADATASGTPGPTREQMLKSLVAAEAVLRLKVPDAPQAKTSKGQA